MHYRAKDKVNSMITSTDHGIPDVQKFQLIKGGVMQANKTEN